MRELYSSPMACLEYSADRQLFIFSWKAACSDLDESGIQSELNTLPENIQKYKPRNVVVDGQRFPFFGNPDHMSWFEVHFLPGLGNLGVTRIALVANSDVVAQLEEERIFSAEDWELAYFISPEEALSWIGPG